jgi:hypothetical protein
LRLSRNAKKYFYTCRTWSLIQKWAAKPIGNKSDNTLKKMSDNTLKTKDEWQHTQKRWTLHSRKVSTTAQNSLQIDHEGSSLENREKLNWV